MANAESVPAMHKHFNFWPLTLMHLQLGALCLAPFVPDPMQARQLCVTTAKGVPAPNPPARKALQRERLALGVCGRLQHCLLAACANGVLGSAPQRLRWLAGAARDCAAPTNEPLVLQAEAH